MLDTLRRAAKSWVAMIPIGLLVLSFTIWGVGDVLRGRIDTAVARVGKVKIDANEFQQTFQREVSRLRDSLGPEFDTAQARALGLDQRILETLIQRTLFDLGARDLAIIAPDDVIAEDIRSNAVFYGPLGSFDRPTFLRIMTQNGLTEARYVAALKQDSRRNQLIETIGGRVHISNALAAPLARYRMERRIAQYVVVPPHAAMDVPTPTQDDARAFFEANKARYMAPEYRHLTLILLDPVAIAKTLPVSDEALEAYFEYHKGEYGTPERRTIEQLVFSSEADALAAAESLAGGKSFIELATAQGKSQTDIELGERTREDLAPALAEAAFALDDGAVSKPVKGAFGWVLLKVTAIAPGQSPTLDEVRDKVRQAVAVDEANNKVFDLGNAIEDARAGGASLEEAARAVDLALTVIEAVDQQGLGPDGQTVAALGGFPEIIDQAFRGEVGDDPDILPLRNGGYYILRVDGATPPAERPFETVAQEVTETITEMRLEEALSAKTKALVEKAKTGVAFSDIASEVGRAALTTQPITRGQSSEVFSAQVIADLFEAKPGDVVSGPVGVGKSRVIMKLSKVEVPEPADDPASFEQAKANLSQVFANELLTQYLIHLEDRFTVHISEQNLRTVLGDDAG